MKNRPNFKSSFVVRVKSKFLKFPSGGWYCAHPLGYRGEEN